MTGDDQPRSVPSGFTLLASEQGSSQEFKAGDDILDVGGVDHFGREPVLDESYRKARMPDESRCEGFYKVTLGLWRLASVSLTWCRRIDATQLGDKAPCLFFVVGFQ